MAAKVDGGCCFAADPVFLSWHLLVYITCLAKNLVIFQIIATIQNKVFPVLNATRFRCVKSHFGFL